MATAAGAGALCGSTSGWWTGVGVGSAAMATTGGSVCGVSSKVFVGAVVSFNVNTYNG